MMGHINQRRNFSLSTQPHKSRKEILARARVHTGAGLIKNNQIRFGHACPSDQNLLLLALRQSSEFLITQAATAHLRQKLFGGTVVRPGRFAAKPFDIAELSELSRYDRSEDSLARGISAARVDVTQPMLLRNSGRFVSSFPSR